MQTQANGNTLPQTFPEPRGDLGKVLHDGGRVVGVVELTEQCLRVNVGRDGLRQAESKSPDNIRDARIVHRPRRRIGVDVQADNCPVAQALSKSHRDGLELALNAAEEVRGVDVSQDGAREADAHVLQQRVQTRGLLLVIGRDLLRDLLRLFGGGEVESLCGARADTDAEEHSRAVEVAEELATDVVDAVHERVAEGTAHRVVHAAAAAEELAPSDCGGLERLARMLLLKILGELGLIFLQDSRGFSEGRGVDA